MATAIEAPDVPGRSERAATPRVRAGMREFGPVVAAYLATRLVSIAVLVFIAGRADVNPWGRLARADATHFLAIADRGYGSSLVRLPDGTEVDRLLVFLPGYPYLVRLVAGVPGLTTYAAGLVVSALAGCVAAALIYALGRDLADRRTGLLLAVLWGAAPSGIVLSMVYSEALFTALAAGSLLALLRRHWLTAGALCLLAGATRATGLAVVAAIGVAALSAAVRRQDGWRPYAAVALAPLGFLGHLAFVAVRTGRVDGWFYVHDEVYGASFDGGRFQARMLVQTLTSNERVVPTVVSLVIIAAIAGLVLLMLERPPMPLLVYTLAVLVLALGQGGFHHSKSRLLLPAFPLLLGFAAALARQPDRVLAVVLPAVALASGWFGGYTLVLWQYSP